MSNYVLNHTGAEIDSILDSVATKANLRIISDEEGSDWDEDAIPSTVEGEIGDLIYYNGFLWYMYNASALNGQMYYNWERIVDLTTLEDYYTKTEADNKYVKGNAKIYYGTCSTAANVAQKDVVCSVYTRTGDPVKGDIIYVTFDNTNAAAVADLTLKVGNSTAKNIKYQGTTTIVNIPDKGYLIANMTYRFLYNGTDWVVMLNYDSNTNTLQRIYASSANVEFPLAGQVNGTAYTAPLAITSSNKACYGAVPNTAANKATINASTGKITIPSGLVLGTSNSKLGNIIFKNAANNYTITLNAGVPVVSRTITLPIDNGTLALLESPSFTGTPTAPTAAAGTNTTQIATTAFVQNAVENYSEIPSYVIEESENTLTKAFSHNISDKIIRFIAVSDNHNDATEISHDYTKIANLHCGQAVKYIADRIPLDFVASLGDMTWAGVSAATYDLDIVKQDIQEMNSFLAEGFKGIPNIRVIGNHDQCLCSSSRLLNSGAYNLMGRYNSGQKTFKSYGYYDLDYAKIRIVYLNTSEITSSNSANSGTLLNVSQDQKNWLAELLIYTNQKADANEWKILIFSHAPLDMVSNIGSDILIPYTNGGTYNSYNFTNHDVEILGNVHGHVHCFSYGYISNKIRRFTIPNSNFYDNNHYKTISGYSQWADTTTYPKTANSRTDTSFSLITIDLENNICYVDNYGAGIDRTFDLGYYKTVSSISNIIYSGPTTIGTTIDKTNISYTLTYSDNSTSTLSGGNITVSPATIASIGNNTVTISYDDGTSSFSSSIIIVGTAIPINNLLNLSNRTYETLATGINISTALDETKAYTNIAYGNGNGATLPVGNCTVTNITEHGLTVTGCSQGGDDVAFPVQIDPTKHYTFSYDYSGSGKVRAHAKWANSSGLLNIQGLYDSTGDTAGASGLYTIDLKPPTEYTWLIIMLSANTNGTKTYSNIVLTEKTT